MKTLIVLRHAKTEERNANGDHERELTARGRRDAALAGQALADQRVEPEVILSSTAIRTVQTAQVVGVVFESDITHLQDERLYLADVDEILETVREFEDGIDVVLLIGHNPGLLDFVNLFTPEGSEREHLPTSGYVVIEFETDSWEDIGLENAHVSPLMTP